MLFKKLGNTAETLHELDRYYENHFPSKIGEKWFIPEGFSKYANKKPLIELHGKVFELLGPILERREMTLDEGCNIVRSLLLALYGDEELDRNSKRLAVLHGIFGVLDRVRFVTTDDQGQSWQNLNCSSYRVNSRGVEGEFNS